MAEAHPVGFQWVMEAKARGAKIIHVDPRFTRTSAVADLHVPLRAGSDIAFLGGLIHQVLERGAEFREYLLAFSNASAIISEDFRDTEDLDGLFSGYDAATDSYDTASWQYAGSEASQDDDERGGAQHPPEGGEDHQDSAQGQAYGSGGASIPEKAQQNDPTLEHPRSVFQILKRHFSRYTPEMVEDVCGVPQAQFLEVADALIANSGRERTSAMCYAVGWTQHTTGTQYIRTASILQTLLGNIGRPGGGIMALRGHASIQGSSDIPTLFNLLPGYLPMPHVEHHQSLEEYVRKDAGRAGFWGNMPAYTVSLLKAWWGDAATAENDFAFDYIPKISGDHGTYRTVMDQIAGIVKGYILLGQNPAVGSANAKMQRLGLANLDWLVVRDMQMIESATFWKDGPEIETGELRTEDIGTEVFFLPAASHVEKPGTFTNTNRMLQWRQKAVDPPGEAKSDLWFAFHLGRIIREKLAASTDERDRPLLDLTWDYPMEPGTDEPEADAVLREINGTDAHGDPLPDYFGLAADGSTTSGCWIYAGVYKDGVNQAARRKPRTEQSDLGAEWGWAWPMNRRILYNRASADAQGRPWSERKKYVWWDEAAGRWTGDDVPDFEATKRPDYVPPEGAKGPAALAGTDAFIMQGDGKAWLYAPSGLSDGPLPTHYEAAESAGGNGLYPHQVYNPARRTFPQPGNRANPTASDVFPYTFTTFRLTEHHTAGGMSRTLPYLSELQPEMTVEVSAELARERGLEHLGWATIVTARSAIEARVMVTPRLRPLTIGGRTMHQIGLPWHWGPNGLSTGDAANELVEIALDPNSHIQDKVGTCDVQPGRRPRGPELLTFVADYRRRAGIPTDADVPATQGGTA